MPTNTSDEQRLEPSHKRLNGLVTLLSSFNSDFAAGVDRPTLYNRLLDGILTHIDASYGFIAESSCHFGDNTIALDVDAVRNNASSAGSDLEAGSPDSVKIHPHSLMGDLFKSALPIISNDYRNNAKAICRLPGNPDLTNFMAIPLLTRNQVIGVIVLGNRRHGFNRGLAVHLAPLANGITALIETGRIAENALFDPLTGLPNKQIFIKRYLAESSRHNRSRRHFSVLRLEIDHLETFRNNLGLLAVEACLKQVATVIRENLRTEDCCVSIGQEQFAVLLTETYKVQAVIVAEKLRQAVSKTLIEAKGLTTMMFPTISIGITCITPEEEGLNDADTAMKTANHALQMARDNGGNQIQAH